MRKMSSYSRRSLEIHLSFLVHVLLAILFPPSTWNTPLCAFSISAPHHPGLSQHSELSPPAPTVKTFWVHKLDVTLSLH